MVSVGSLWGLGTKDGGDQLEVIGLCVWLLSGLNYIIMEERKRALPLEFVKRNLY